MQKSQVFGKIAITIRKKNLDILKHEASTLLLRDISIMDSFRNVHCKRVTENFQDMSKVE